MSGGGARPRVLLRADAGPGAGAGHLARSIALAEGFARAGAEPLLVTPGLPPGMARLVEGRRVRHVPVPGLAPGDPGPLAGLAGKDAALVVLDGYRLGPDAVAAARRAAPFVVALADGDAPAGVDAVVDHELCATPGRYPGVPLRLLGPRYALLREEFRDPPPRPLREPGPPLVLVTLGGSATGRLGRKVLDLLAAADRPFRARIVGNPWEETPAPRPGATPVSIEFLPPLPSLVEELSRASVALLAAGGTRFEAARCGCAMLLGVLADNQVDDARAFVAAGAARGLGRWDDLDPAEGGMLLRELLDRPDLRRELATRAAALVDGRGAERAARELLAAARSAAGRETR